MGFGYMHHRRSRQSGSPQPPWGKDWTPGDGSEERANEWRRIRRYVFGRFVFVLALFSSLFMAVLGAFILLLLGPVRAGQVDPRILLALGCGVPLVVVSVIMVAGGWAFRRYGTPLAEIMTAADAVAQGDLGVRVRESGRGEVARLAGRFNNMTAELERAEQQRRNITADIAHELRTPLHIIQGNLEGVIDGVYEPTAEHLNATLEETHRLTRLVSDLQTLSLAEAGELPLHPAPLLVSDLLDDVAARFSAAAAEQEVVLTVEPGPPGLMLYADADRLEQVLSNLVGNALRHSSPGGSIILRAKPLDERILLSVADTGSGIPAEDLPYVFDRFWRGDKARTRNAGSGLGLAIARQLVQSHGGMIRAESELGQGTVFTVELQGYAPPDG